MTVPDTEHSHRAPLLIVLECYVLDCIGYLPPEKASLAATVVQRVFGGGGDWKFTVREQLMLSEGLDHNLKDLWTKDQVIAREANSSLQPEQFAKTIVNENFADMLDPKAGTSSKPWWKLW